LKIFDFSGKENDTLCGTEGVVFNKGESNERPLVAEFSFLGLIYNFLPLWMARGHHINAIVAAWFRKEQNFEMVPTINAFPIQKIDLVV